MPRELIRDRHDGQQWATYPMPDGVIAVAFTSEHMDAAANPAGPAPAVMGSDGNRYPMVMSEPRYIALIIDWDDNLLQVAVAAVNPETDEILEGENPTWITLDRPAANRAIRFWRKARNFAFGEDA